MKASIRWFCAALLTACLLQGGVLAAAGAAVPADSAGLVFVDEDGSAGCWAVSPSAQDAPRFLPNEERLAEGTAPGVVCRRPPQPRSLSPPAV